jgi:hypothetical protein
VCSPGSSPEAVVEQISFLFSIKKNMEICGKFNCWNDSNNIDLALLIRMRIETNADPQPGKDNKPLRGL